MRLTPPPALSVAEPSILADERALAMTEFALSLPLLLMLFLYGTESVHLAIASMRVNQIANTIADNAARVRDDIDEGDVNELLLGANLIGSGIDFGPRGRVIVSSVSPNGRTGTAAGQWIRWQRCTGALNTPESQPRYGREGAGQTGGSIQYMGSSNRRIAATSSSTLIFTEVTYRYKPIVSDMLFGSKTLRAEAAFTVRERTKEDLAAVAGVTKSVCSVYSAK